MSYRQFYGMGNIKDSISEMQHDLECIMKNLTKYIEEKREKFPRFYFLSNQQIIEMCGVMEDIHALERSFVKMFEGIDKIIIAYKEHELSLEDRIELTQ